jgi:transposase
VGTPFHGTHVPLAKWFLLIYLLQASKNQISARQMQRILGVGYETAWSMVKRVLKAEGKEKQLLHDLFRNF